MNMGAQRPLSAPETYNEVAVAHPLELSLCQRQTTGGLMLCGWLRLQGTPGEQGDDSMQEDAAEEEEEEDQEWQLACTLQASQAPIWCARPVTAPCTPLPVMGRHFSYVSLIKYRKMHASLMSQH
jgi:hypothetical protein